MAHCLSAAEHHPNTGSRSGSGWLVAGYAGAAGFFVQERFLRRPGAASSLTASPDDQGTTRMLLASSGLAYGLPLVLRRFPLPMMPSTVAAMGLIMQASGFALRIWSMHTSVASTPEPCTSQDQHVVDTGPYRKIRHPGYTGALLVWIGLALTSRSVPATLLVAGLMGRAYRRRITVEENLLQRALPEYGDHRRRTKRTIPLTW